MTTLTIGAAEFRALVNPVLPMAARDEMGYPSITAVLIESDGKWLSAMTTDRFRIGIKRIAKRPTDDDPTTEWPKFRALVPVRAVRSMLTTFKARRGTQPATLTFTVEDDKLTAEAAGLFDLFDAGRFTHNLVTAEFPNLRQVVRNALKDSDKGDRSSVGINPGFMADFKASGATTLRVLFGGGVASPLVVTDDDGFIGVLMPRRLLEGSDGPEDWTDFLAEKPAPKKATAKKDVA